MKLYYLLHTVRNLRAQYINEVSFPDSKIFIIIPDKSRVLREVRPSRAPSCTCLIWLLLRIRVSRLC